LAVPRRLTGNRKEPPLPAASSSIPPVPVRRGMPSRAPDAAFAASIILAAAGCGRADQTQDALPQATAAAALPDPSVRSTMLAAAEGFENLTEASLSADLKSIGAELALARREAEAARPFLDAPNLRQLTRLESGLSDALGSGKAVDLSLVSNEIYRLFITAARREAKVPLEIGLLGYAGFRYRADGRDQPPRWDDMARAHAYAEQQWRAVRSRIGDRQAVVPDTRPAG